tara:strand:- start:340 stop:1011 length:672 start_codon:yes stop_codon:yes gene_type:complete
MKRIIRLLTLYLSTLILLSCSSLKSALQNNIASGYGEAFRTVKAALFGAENTLITQDLVDNIPYASMMVSIGKGAPALMILETVNGEETNWISADNVFFKIKRGKIVQTSGLLNNLVRVESPKYSFNLRQENSFYSYYSYDKPKADNIKLTISRKIKSLETVYILNKEMELLLIEEELISRYLGWKIKNKYWIDDEGFVWKSIQTISPKIPPIEILITKKPST